MTNKLTTTPSLKRDIITLCVAFLLSSLVAVGTVKCTQTVLGTEQEVHQEELPTPTPYTWGWTART